MFTAQQLYEILTHKDDESLRADGQPQKRTADLLYSLLDGYKKNRPDDLLEFDFAEALDTMLQKAEIVKDVVDSLSETKEYFAKQVQDVVDKFHAAYAKLPKQIREQAKLVEFSRELGIAAPREQIKSEQDSEELEETRVSQHGSVRSSQPPADVSGQAQNTAEEEPQKREGSDNSVQKSEEEALKHRFEEKMAQLAALFMDEYETYHQHKQSVLSGNAVNKPDMERSEKRLKDDLATLLVMDKLQREGKMAAALDQSKRNSEKERLTQTGKFSTFWNMVHREKRDIDGLENLFKSFVSAGLAQRLVQAAEALTERREQAAAVQGAQAVSQTEVQKPDAKETFDKLSKELAESTAQIFETVTQLRDGKHPWQKKDSPLSAEELKDLVAVNNEKLKANIAALVAMDHFRKNGKLEAAADPDQLEETTNKILDGEGIDNAMAILLVNVGRKAPKNLTDFFRQIHRPELSELLASVEKPTLNRQNQENVKNTQGPEKKQEDRELTEADSPTRRFQAGLKKLQEEVKAYDSGKARLNIAESRKGVLKLLALREMGADQNIGPNTPVSDQEVRDRMHAILQKKGDGHSLYRAVYDCLKSEYKIGKVVAAIQGGEPTKEFRSKLMNAAELKPKEKETKKEASVGPNPVKQ